MEKIKITPEIVEEHGLSPDEYDKVLEILGREPTITELGIFSVMWSEHCSYKCSKKQLRTLPTTGKCVLQGPGENAGIIDIGNGLAIVFKIESHNHPSAVEPYEGAATGIGGILRDIFTMGARPIALLDSLHFGKLDDSRQKYLFEHVVKGIADYGNCVGIPTIAGEIYFDDSYRGNCLINVMAVGIMKQEDITYAIAEGKGNPVIYYGSSTGRDGIHGATFASVELSDESESKRASVQVGDPFTEKLILEATLELIEKGLWLGIQDMGAAGLTCSSCEMAGRGGTGIEIDLDKVPQRAEGLTAYEIMLSESQERMLGVCTKENEPDVKKILNKWGLEAHVLGEVRDDGILQVKHLGEVVAEMPAAPLSEEAPVYSPESKRPSYLDKINKCDYASAKIPEDLNKVLLNLLSNPTIASKRWVYEQYDHMVQTNTAVPPGRGDAGVLRIRGTNKAIAITTDCNGFQVYLDPKAGASMAVAEAARNLVCTGAKPLAITNCLNFGNPTKPEIFWQFKEAVAGMKEACEVLDTPVTGGNVSFYNESYGEAVYPTPVIGMIGLIEDVNKIITKRFQFENDKIILLGQNPSSDICELGGSMFLKDILGTQKGPCPSIDLDMEKRIQQFTLEMIDKGIVHAAHDCSEGGLGVALAEICIAGKLGANISIKSENPALALFNEYPSRILLSVSPENEGKVLKEAEEKNIPCAVLGTSTGKRLVIKNVIDLSLEDLTKSFEGVFNDF